MSSILKALKKLEDDKAARPAGSLDIGADILRGYTPQRFSLTGVTLVATLLFVCGSGVTYFYMKRAIVQQPPPVTPAASGIAPHQPQRLQTGSRPEPRQAPAAGSQNRHKAVASPVAARPRRVYPTAQSPRKEAATETKRPGTEEVSHQPASSAPQGAPVIKVNGIAFQGDGAGSVAVVNGVPVANGSMVEGARVEDIQKDRVRFSYGGEKFEVTLGKSNR